VFNQSNDIRVRSIFLESVRSIYPFHLPCGNFKIIYDLIFIWVFRAMILLYASRYFYMFCFDLSNWKLSRAMGHTEERPCDLPRLGLCLGLGFRFGGGGRGVSETKEEVVEARGGAGSAEWRISADGGVKN
jgi:hypothetical protein